MYVESTTTTKADSCLLFTSTNVGYTEYCVITAMLLKQCVRFYKSRTASEDTSVCVNWASNFVTKTLKIDVYLLSILLPNPQGEMCAVCFCSTFQLVS